MVAVAGRAGVVTLMALLLALLGGGGAERQRLESDAPRRWAASLEPAAAASRSRRRLLTGVVLLGNSWHARAKVSPKIEEMFRSIDVDGDGLLSETEYNSMLAIDDRIKEVIAPHIFVQADIDDDRHLSLTEFLFARYISDEPLLDRQMNDVADYLPPNYRDSIDSKFAHLRAAPSAGALRFDELWSMLKVYITSKENMESSRTAVEEIFRVADVTGDGRLNLNELDFCQFMVREAMMEHALQTYATKRVVVAQGNELGQQANTQQLEQEEPQEPWDDDLGKALFANFDKNGDGMLSESELVAGMQTHFADTDKERQVYAQYVHTRFAEVDTNFDGSLDEKETVELMSRLMAW